MMCLGVCFLGSNFFGTLWAFWTSWKSISFARLGKFYFIVFSNKFSSSCSFFFCFWHPYNLDVGTFKVVLEVPKPLLIFLNSCSFILFWLGVSFFLLFQTVDLCPGFLPVTVGSLYFPLFYFHSLHFFLHFAYSTNSVSILITSILNCASVRLAISLLLSRIFSGALICWAIFFLS